MNVYKRLRHIDCTNWYKFSTTSWKFLNATHAISQKPTFNHQYTIARCLHARYCHIFFILICSHWFLCCKKLSNCFGDIDKMPAIDLNRKHKKTTFVLNNNVLLWFLFAFCTSSDVGCKMCCSALGCCLHFRFRFLLMPNQAATTCH